MSFLSHRHPHARSFFFLFLAVIIGLLVGFSLDEKNPSLQANTLSQRREFVQEQGLERAVETQDFDVLIPRFRNFAGVKSFFDDLGSCTYISDSRITLLRDGFWLSYLCAQNTDRLAPFFGFFNEETQQIYWGVAPTGKILSVEQVGSEKEIVFQNTSAVPLPLTSEWKDATGNMIYLSSAQGKNEIGAGEEGMVKTNLSDESSLYEEQNTGLYLLLEK